MMPAARMTATEIVERLCPSCKAWLCAPDDAFCGACGQKCAQLQFEAMPSVLQIGQVPPRIGLKVTNVSLAPARILRFTTPGWLDVAMPADAEIEPGGTLVLRAKANTFTHRVPGASDVRVHTSIGDASGSIIVIPEAPALNVSPVSIEYWPDKRGAREYDLDVYPAEGHLLIRRLWTSQSHDYLSIVGVLRAPFLAGRDRALPLKVSLQPDRLPQGTSSIRLIKATLHAEYEGPHGPAQASVDFAIQVRRPPELTWTGEHASPVTRLRTAGQMVRCMLTNADEKDPMGGRHNGRLVIYGAALSGPAGASAVPVQPLTPLPMFLAGGESKPLDFQVDCRALEPAIHSLTLVLQSNRPGPPVKYHVPIQVRALVPFEGVAAIDFGTSNTCCALLPDDGGLLNVPLDEGRTTAPTIVRYLDLSGVEPVIETGLRVKHLAAVDERVASSTVARLKQQLGEATHPITVKPEASAQWLTREARDAAGDYLRHVRAVVEREQGAIFREFILTHPAVCSLRQFRNLRSAVEQAFGREMRVYFLQEPIAALVPLFRKRAQRDAQGTYTVAAFDLGGGTTDITIVRVVHEPTKNGVLEIRPEILASWGERFGGEDLTDYLLDELRARCGHVLALSRPGYDLAQRDVPGASTSGVRRNEAALRVWAEAFKVSWSEDRHDADPAESVTLTVVPRSSDELPDEQQFSVQAVQRVGNDLASVFAEQLEVQISRLAERLQDSLGETNLDLIQLSGKTAFLPDVARVLEAYFPDAGIERAEDPKECVVRGACLWWSLSRGRQRRLVLSSSARTTSQIGTLDDDDNFQPIIPLDCPISDDGLRAFSNGWQPVDAIVLWENLGPDNRCVREDGTRNVLISRLDTWDVPEHAASAESWDGIEVSVRPDFSIHVRVQLGGTWTDLRPRGQRS
jgi:molecular chaperone DnaK (HSP70)